MPQQEREAKQRKGKRARASQPFTPGGAWRGASGATAARAGRRKTGRGPARCLPGPPQRVRRARQKAERGRQTLARRLDARARVKPAKPTKKALPVQKRPAGIAKGPAGRKIRFSVRVFRSGLPPPPGAASGSRARGAWHEPCPRGACFTKLPGCMNQQVSGYGRGHRRGACRAVWGMALRLYNPPRFSGGPAKAQEGGKFSSLFHSMMSPCFVR